MNQLSPKEAELKKLRLSQSDYETLKDLLQREPTQAEMGVCAALWSEHCSYKSSKKWLKTLPQKAPWVVYGPGENAGVVTLKDDLCLAFKMESHNHPSYIDPFQGAQTGVGGIMRDVFCMGARPIANFNALRFGSLKHPHNRWLFKNVVRGIGAYGNCVGIPTTSGSVAFHDSYHKNCLVNAMSIGLVKRDKIFTGHASGPGNLLLYVGSPTGLDGICGAAMASASFSKDQTDRTTVQVGDPYLEKLLLEATLSLLDKGLAIGLQDMGAAGLTSSSFEMAEKAGSGLLIDLDKVPVRTPRMTAYELMLSESQERMLFVIKPNDYDAVCQVLQSFDLAYAVIGTVTASDRVVITYKGQTEVDIPLREFCAKTPQYDRPYIFREPSRLCFKQEALSRTQIASMLTRFIDEGLDHSYIYSQFDHHIGNRTVIGPEKGGATVLWIKEANDYTGISVAVGCHTEAMAQDAYLGAQITLASLARKIIATGAVPLALTDCLNFGNPENKATMGDLVAAIKGLKDAAIALEIPVVSGNVSLYNETDGDGILPTPMVGLVGNMPDVRKAIPASPMGPCLVFLLYPQGVEPFPFGYLEKMDDTGHYHIASSFKWPVEQAAHRILKVCHDKGILAACKAIGQGGPLVSLMKALSCHKLGVSIQDLPPELTAHPFLEWQGSYLLFTHRNEMRFREELAKDVSQNGFMMHYMGETTLTPELVWQELKIPLSKSLRQGHLDADA